MYKISDEGEVFEDVSHTVPQNMLDWPLLAQDGQLFGVSKQREGWFVTYRLVAFDGKIWS